MSKMICKCKEESFSGLENKYFTSYPEALDYLDNKIDFEKEYPNSMATIKRIQYGEHSGKYQIFNYPRSNKDPFSGSDKSTGKYRVIKGTWEGRIFNGHEVVISGEKRIWNDDSVGHSYPIENTEKLNEFSGRIVNEELAKSSPCNKVESVRFFKKGIAGSLNKEQVKNYCFEKD